MQLTTPIATASTVEDIMQEDNLELVPFDENIVQQYQATFNDIDEIEKVKEDSQEDIEPNTIEKTDKTIT